MDNNEILCYYVHNKITIPFDMVTFYEKDPDNQTRCRVHMLNQMYITLHEDDAKVFVNLYLAWLNTKNVRKLRPIPNLTIKNNCIK